ncbi:hypothetical protein HK097_008926 [Rhizophlyctis rosea]|uniref:Inner membrane component domain-containing protein n=1 Tax=Rhizophlyctis rosea TaxID=64517 RepID=A0AAD5X1E0_9FUNG|nr:hypothetical protein HK097_008926 [Rhizophlyctis rosea]
MADETDRAPSFMLGNRDGKGIPDQTYTPTFAEKCKYYLQYAMAIQRRPPWLWVSRVLWVVLGGWSLFVFYVLGAITMASTIILLPFAWQALKLGVFALIPIGREPYTPPLRTDQQLSFFEVFQNPMHPLTIIANVVWLVLIGWETALLHLFWALTNFISIIGVANGVQHLRLAKFALWPFGKSIRSVDPPPFPMAPGIRVPNDEV